MGIEEAILEDVRKQGRAEGLEQGAEIREAQILLQTIPHLIEQGLDLNTIAAIFRITEERVL
jgi:hypothetical protein